MFAIQNTQFANTLRIPEHRGIGGFSFLKVAGIALTTMALSTALYIRWKTTQERNTPFCCSSEQCANPKSFFNKDFTIGSYTCPCPSANATCLARDEWWLRISENLPNAIRSFIQDKEFVSSHRLIWCNFCFNPDTPRSIG